MVERVTVPAEMTGATPPVVPPATEAGRPAELPENFGSVSDLVKSYKELQAKLTGQSQTPPVTPPAPATPPATSEATKAGEKPTNLQIEQASQALEVAGLNMSEFSDEFAKEGKLSDGSYAKLAEKGFSKDVVNTFMRGVQADAKESASVFEGKVYDSVGGKEQFTQISAWAGKNLSAAELAGYNAIADSNDAAAISFALQGLKTRMESAEGREPNLIGGKGSNSSTDAYGSWAQVKSDMRDPRYASDPAFRKAVEQKVMRSNIQ